MGALALVLCEHIFISNVYYESFKHSPLIDTISIKGVSVSDSMQRNCIY